MRGQSVSSGVRARVTGRDRSLERVWTALGRQLLRALERRKTATDEQLIPERSILVVQQHGRSGSTDTRARARRLDLHQRDEAVDLGLLQSDLGENAAEAEPLLA